MAGSVNKGFILVGNLGRDPEVRNNAQDGHP